MVPMEVEAVTFPFWSVERRAFGIAVKKTEEVAVNWEVEALVKFWVAVHQLERLVLRESVVDPPRATDPPPERPEPAVTVRLAFWSWALPMVEVETNLVPSYERRVPVV